MHQPVESIANDDRLMIIKLANGETVIGNVERETQGYVEIKTPFKLIMFFNQRGNINLSIVKWDLTIDMDYPVRVFKNTIVACGKPTEQMVKNYREVVEGGFDTDMEDESTTEQDLETIEEKVAELLKQTKGAKLH